ncbi:MAG: UDP-glucose 4-epimerase GalE [Nevskia sp.]|nr:UDP-glucose 4-epimerase GalE [Nevskia sp.]
MRVMVVGGAGYIGSHMCKMLAEHGHDVVVCDNLSTGHAEALHWGRLVHCRLSDSVTLDQVFSAARFDAVMHFAADSIVSDSVADPLRYYRNNVAETIALLEVMRRHDVNNFIFSSTAAVFGEPTQTLIDESHPVQPINPYGKSKVMVEQILGDVVATGVLRAVALRYFNAAGADPSGLIGESHNPETHLIPRILRKATGEALDFGVFGEDYPTADGTCVRDFVHVSDLCSAHLLALEFLGHNAGFHTFNLGNGQGYSVRQVLDATQQVIGRKMTVPVYAKRKGDPARLVASSEKAYNIMGWAPLYPDIHDIIESAWKWHLSPRY